ncbi:MAG: signal peptidase II [Pseudoflavonifractor sp.]|nr:signal peptidase II [Pseudoflavonifractor sp.]
MLYYILAAVLVVIDQLVKLWVRASIPLGESIPFLPGLMDLTYIQNTGAAFSSFSSLTWLLALISLIASAAVAVLMARKLFTKPLGQLSLALILAGAVGNLIDRALLGFVTDMFATAFMNFAVFNVADICVVVGGILMVLYVLFFYDKQKEAPHDAP